MDKNTTIVIAAVIAIVAIGGIVAAVIAMNNDDGGSDEKYELDATELAFATIGDGRTIAISDDISGEGKTREMTFPMDLSGSGEATIVISGCTDATKVDENTFSGTGQDSEKYYIDIGVTGADSYTLSVSGTTVYLNFTYSNDVKMTGVYYSSLSV